MIAIPFLAAACLTVCAVVWITGDDPEPEPEFADVAALQEAPKHG